MAFLHTGPLLAAAPCLASPDRRPPRFPATACPPRQPAFRVRTFIKTSQLMLYKAKAAVCSQIRTKHSTQSEHHVEFLNVTPGGT